jgi:hypothetical protein
MTITRDDLLNELAKVAFGDVTPAATRMRRNRERRRDGMRCLNIELRETEIDALIQKRMLKSETRNDPRAIEEALYAYLDQNLSPAWIK